ncbi:MAG: tyrosine-type recombinase/integrase [Planctomycetota bacterium]|jgi:site-specific recombinase XerD
MGKIKSDRTDIIRPDELKVYLAMAKRNPKHQGLMAMLYAYGKRVSEVVPMKRSELQFTDKGLMARFLILKHRPKSGVLPYKWKRLSLEHWLYPYIEGYTQFRDRQYGPEGLLFPSHSESGHLTRQGALWILKKYSPDIWPHLFRHSLAVQMAESGATLPDLIAYFDWLDDKTAVHYIRTYGQAMDILADKWAERPF